MTDLKDIKAFAFDIDGVFTNGGILCDLNGELYRTFDAKDGFAVRMAFMNGYPMAIVTGARSQTIIERFKTNGIGKENIFLGSRDKVSDLHKFCAAHGIEPKDVLYVGDDLPDLPIFNICGVSVCPCDAVQEVLDAADIVSTKPGGKGCIREILERVMKLQGRWTFDVQQYKKDF